MSLVWFAAIEAVFAQFTHKPLYALLSSLAIIFFIMFLVFVLVERVLAWHIVLLPPSLLLIFIRTCYALGERQALRTISSGNI